MFGGLKKHFFFVFCNKVVLSVYFFKFVQLFYGLSVFSRSVFTMFLEDEGLFEMV